MQRVNNITYFTVRNINHDEMLVFTALGTVGPWFIIKAIMEGPTWSLRVPVSYSGGMLIRSTLNLTIALNLLCSFNSHSIPITKSMFVKNYS